MTEKISFYDFRNYGNDLKPELLNGLLQEHKSIPPKFFYDKNGSELFDAITKLPEYYITTKEIQILETHIEEICRIIGEDSALIEYGGANLRKVNIILDNCKGIRSYFPIDISAKYMLSSARQLSAKHAELHIVTISADFTKKISIPGMMNFTKRTIIFLGSSIGNFEPADASKFLRNASDSLIGGDCMIIGVDMKKDKEVIEKAYNDSLGVTARFNLNLIGRINSEFNANIDVGKFTHKAVYNSKEGRIEMYLQVNDDFTTYIDGNEIRFRKGETIHTENSYKYDEEQFKGLCENSGFTIKMSWRDNDSYFSIFVLEK